MAVNLTTIKRVKQFMGLDVSDSSKDELITYLINAASQQIAEYCDRTFAETTYKVWLDGNGSNRLRLPEYPVKRVYGVALSMSDAGSISYTGSGSIASAGLSSSNLNLMHVSSSGADTETDITLSGKNVTELATAINAVTGWTFSTATNAGSLAATQIRPFSSGDVVSPSDYDMETTAASDYEAARIVSDTEDTIELEHGGCFCCGMSNVFVWYKAGYTLPTEAQCNGGDVPEGLEMICVKIVKQLFESGTVSGVMRSEKIGDYQYTLKDSDVIDGGALRNFVASMGDELWQYVRKTL
jgi:hypothetical protein